MHYYTYLALTIFYYVQAQTFGNGSPLQFRQQRSIILEYFGKMWIICKVDLGSVQVIVQVRVGFVQGSPPVNTAIYYHVVLSRISHKRKKYILYKILSKPRGLN
jgi:hypothetical protein